MKVHIIFLIALTVVLVVSLVSIWSVSSFQDFMAGNRMWNGVRDFLRNKEVTTIESLDSITNAPPDTSLIVIPYLEFTESELLKLKDFVDQGGTLLLLDDYGYGNSILEYLGVKVRFSGEPLIDPLFCYKNQSLPRVTDFPPSITEKGVSLVVLNHATVLKNTEDAEVLALSSLTSLIDVSQTGGVSAPELTGPFPVAARVRIGNGTIILASDPSLMINSMVNRDDNSVFVTTLIELGGVGREVLFDVSHLTQTPLDVSKAVLITLRDKLSPPYASFAIVFVIFVAASRFLLKRQEVKFE